MQTLLTKTSQKKIQRLAEYPEKITLVNDNNQRFSIEKAEAFAIYKCFNGFWICQIIGELFQAVPNDLSYI